MMGSWYMILLVIAASNFMHTPPPQVWGPFLTQERCVAAYEAARDTSLEDADWAILDAVCVEGPTPTREMEVRWPSSHIHE